MKRCSKCGMEKEEHEFAKDDKSSSGLKYSCKSCCNQMTLNWRNKNREQIKNYNKKYKSEHAEEVAEYKKLYEMVYRKETTQQNNRYIRNKKKVDPFFALNRSIHSTITSSIKAKGSKKSSKVEQLLQCSLEEFFSRIGPKPKGKYHLDHICPCAQAQNEEELLKLQNYRNFRWLPAEENLRKSNKKTVSGVIMCSYLLNRQWIGE